MSALAQIKKITKIIPIKKADFIEAVEVDGGWECVVKKNEFQLNDLCVYFEIGSFLPIDPRFEFLRKMFYKSYANVEGFRLRTVCMKGKTSQGLCLPLSMFPEITNPIHGLDVTYLLKVIKYEPPLDDPTAIGYLPENLGIDKSDAERIQNTIEAIETFKEHDVEVSVKMHGTSFTCYYLNGKFGVCGRNIEFSENFNVYWKIAKYYRLEERLRLIGRNVSIQGEICGPGICGNIDNLTSQKLFIYNVKDLNTKQYLPIDFQYDSWTNFVVILNNLHLIASPDVIDKMNLLDRPVLHTVKILEVSKFFKLHPDKNSILYYAEGKSEFNPLKEREGIVLKIDIKEDDKLKRTVLKVISNKFLNESGDVEDEIT